MPTDRRWSYADRELVGRTLAEASDRVGLNRYLLAAEVLDALTAAGWRHPPQWVHDRTGVAYCPGTTTAEPALTGTCANCGEEIRAVVARAHATTPAEEPEPEPPRTPCPEGFHWIGQPLDACDQCGLPAWEHEGSAVPNPDLASPFDAPKWVLEPWKPGEREVIRRRWDPNYATTLTGEDNPDA